MTDDQGLPRSQPATHAALSESERPQASRLSNAVFHCRKSARFITGPCPGISVSNSVCSTASSALAQPSGQAVSMNGTMSTTRSPTIASFVSGSYSQMSASLTANGATRTSSCRPAMVMVADWVTGTVARNRAGLSITDRPRRICAFCAGGVLGSARILSACARLRPRNPTSAPSIAVVA